jgi:hypothetical protein
MKRLAEWQARGNDRRGSCRGLDATTGACGTPNGPVHRTISGERRVITLQIGLDFDADRGAGWHRSRGIESPIGGLGVMLGFG